MTANLTVDRDGRVIAWNEGAVRLLGYPESRAVGQWMEFFIPEQYRADHWTGFRSAIASETLAFGPSDILPVEMIHQNGTRLPIDVTILPQRDADGRIVTLTASLRPAGPR